MPLEEQLLSGVGVGCVIAFSEVEESLLVIVVECGFVNVLDKRKVLEPDINRRAILPIYIRVVQGRMGGSLLPTEFFR